MTRAFIQPGATVDATAIVGDRTKVWAGAGILAGCQIGVDCSIGRNAEIGRGSVIGDGSRIGSGAFLPPNSVVGKRVFIGPNVTCTDDKHPRVPDAFDPPYTAQPPIIEDFASIGAAAVLLPGVRIGKSARVAAGAVVTHDVGEGECVLGVPARPHQMPPEWAEPGVARG